MTSSESTMGVSPLVSVVIPTFNRAELLRECLNSLREQTFRDFEVLVYDDGSTDNTPDIIRSFQSLLPLRSWRFDNSGRPAVGRNHLIRQSRSEYIAFLDSDDLWSPTKLVRSVEILEKGYDFVYHDLWMTRNLGRHLGRKCKSRSMGRNPSIFLAVRGNVIPTSSVVVRRSVVERVGSFDESERLKGVEDADLWLRLAELGIRFKRIRACLGTYRLHSESLSLSEAADTTLLQSAGEHVDSPSNPRGWFVLGMAYYHLRRGERRTAFRLFVKAAFTSSPHRLRRDRLRSIVGALRCLIPPSNSNLRSSTRS